MLVYFYEKIFSFLLKYWNSLKLSGILLLFNRKSNNLFLLHLFRYVDRYMPPAAHTPTDRYVPTSDPGDPYMRRDLGFHHHYRLPPPAGYPYQTHFRFRGFAYATSGRLGGSPGSSSSSSTASNQRETFATSPLLRPKVRGSAVEFGTAATVTSTTTTGVGRHVCANPTACCGDTSANGRACCQMRRSLPPGTLPAIPTQTSSWWVYLLI